MDIDLILKELKKDGWWLENHFYNENKDFLQAIVNETEKQLALCNVSCSLPSKEELFSILEHTVEEKHKGLDEIYKEYIKLGFLYYHRYLSEKIKD